MQVACTGMEEWRGMDSQWNRQEQHYNSPWDPSVPGTHQSLGPISPWDPSVPGTQEDPSSLSSDQHICVIT